MLHTFGLAFMLALTGAVAPGPVLVLVIGQVLAQGIMAAVFILLGHAVLEFLLILGLAHGLKNLLSSRILRSVLGIIGGCVLIWMGWDIFRHAGEMVLTGNTASVMSRPKLILAGIGVSLSNPYFTGWWATVGTGQVAALKLTGWRDYSVFFAGHELGDLAWYLFVAVLIATGRGWLTPTVYEIVLKITAVVILLFGAGFLIISGRSMMRRKQELTSEKKE